MTDDSLGLPAGDYVSLLRHSGSRGTGAQVCPHYSRLAMARHKELPKELKHLAWLSLEDEAGQEYWNAMKLMGHYAAANHALIHKYITRSLGAAPHLSRYRSPGFVTARVQALAKPGCHLLDVGIGTGLSIRPYVEDTRFERIVGVDPSREMLAICRRKFPSVIAVEGTITAVGEVSKFDVVQSCGAVEHIAELRAFFAEVSRRLKRAGYFVFTYELLIPAAWLQSASAPHFGTWGRARVYRRTPAEVQANLAAAELRICEEVEFQAYLGLLHCVVVAQRA